MAVCALAPACANAVTSVTLAWEPSPSKEVVGYHVVYAISSSTNTETIDVGNATTATISALSDSTTYSFAAVAYDKDGTESVASNRVTINQGRVANLSTRVGVGSYGHVLINGFIISGNDPKTIVVRAIGPSLSQFGVAGVLADPVLKLYDSTGALIGSNDNWRESQEAAFAEGGPFHDLQPSSETESAIGITLPPGSYTAIVSGKDNTEGVALAELYDYSPNVDSQLSNISARALVQGGDNVLIGGVTIDGEGSASRSARLILRAIGPALAAYGVTDTLNDPTLALYDSNGTLLGFNDDWQESLDQANEISASGFAPTNSLESAMAILLPAGNYTAIVRGYNGAQGVALFDAYQVP
ncbi:MAG: hypothetical protein QOH24_2162 [Verrucomicrobiota bacterium]|jgi:hypothetical protein